MQLSALLVTLSICSVKAAAETVAATTLPSVNVSAAFDRQIPQLLHQHIPATGLAVTSVKNPAEYLIRRYRGKRAVSRVVIDPDGTSYHCYKVKVKDGDNSKVKRGCVAVPLDKGACEVLEGDFGQTAIENCRACSGDKCNSSVALRVSYTIMALTICLPLVLRIFMYLF